MEVPTQSGRPVAPSARLLSRRQAGELLGVSYSTIEQLELSGRLTPVHLHGEPKRGRKVFYRIEDVMRLVNVPNSEGRTEARNEGPTL
jgi:hypothetical protein